MFESTTKDLVFNDEARTKLLGGVTKLADAVRVTMGPGGLNVVIEQGENLLPVLTKDGVTVAKAVNLKDKIENIGVQLVKEAASGAAEIAGDGTTTATVLAHSIFDLGLRSVNSGYNPVKLRKGIKAAAQDVVEIIKKQSFPVSSNEDIISVGTISANGEREIGELLCQAMDAVGLDGVITVEEAKGFKTSLTQVEGTRIDRGYLSPYFINDEARNVCKLDKPLVLLTNKKISSLKEILGLLEKIHASQRSLLIIADDVDGDALNGLVLNSAKGILKNCCIRAPEFGVARINAMEDLAFLLGTEVISAADETSLNTIDTSFLGTCEKIVISRNETLIVGTKVSKKDIKKRCDNIRESLIVPGLSENDTATIRRRLARLSSGVAILRVGGATEAELRERKDRVEDALHATRVAAMSGISLGGGTSLLRAANELQTDSQDLSFMAGYNLCLKACQAPLRQIVTNSGGVPELIIGKLLEMDNKLGYDARNQKFVDLLESGIIDPTLVIVSSLEHAVSAADNLLSVSCAMYNVSDDEEPELQHYERQKI